MKTFSELLLDTVSYCSIYFVYKYTYNSCLYTRTRYTAVTPSKQLMSVKKVGEKYVNGSIRLPEPRGEPTLCGEILRKPLR